MTTDRRRWRTNQNPFSTRNLTGPLVGRFNFGWMPRWLRQTRRPALAASLLAFLKYRRYNPRFSWRYG
jgi:hypothetical protein